MSDIASERAKVSWHLADNVMTHVWNPHLSYPRAISIEFAFCVDILTKCNRPVNRCIRAGSLYISKNTLTVNDIAEVNPVKKHA